MGGTSRRDRDALYNLLALDPEVHNGGPLSVHALRVWSEERGYLVPKRDNSPGLVPVLLHDGQLVLLTAAGGYTPIKV